MSVPLDHWIAAPVILPGFVAAFMLLVLRHSLTGQRLVSLSAVAAVLAISIRNVFALAPASARAYQLGDWSAPFGIVLVLDQLSATMVLLASVLAAAVLVYAATGWDRRGRHFHPLFQFQLMGVNGAFMTGDVFNLFVFFEVMLIASYGLMLHGGGPRRLVAGFQYVAINLVGSTLFLFAVGVIYAVTGTLNMADLAVKVPQVAPSDTALLATGGLLLLMVFCLKAALVPLQWWLPTAYAAASAPAAALFMIMTKVGAYSIIRVYTLVFGGEAGPLASLAAPWLVPAALVTLVVGAVGTLASRTLVDVICFATVWSMGSLLVAIGLFDAGSLAAALYYTLHSTLAGAALFLIGDLVIERRGRWSDTLLPSAPFAKQGAIAALFFIGAIALAGLPPLSGFIGKVLILDASRASAWGVWIWAVVLGSSILLLLSLARAGSVLFWKSGSDKAPQIEDPSPNGLGWRFAAIGGLLVMTAMLSAFAGPVHTHLDATAHALMQPSLYVEAVLGAKSSVQAGVRP